MKTTLTRYWFKFKFNSVTPPAGLGYGCGVTAFDLNDAKEIMKLKMFSDKEIPEIQTQMEDVDIRTLDAGHVIPNMHSPDKRGIWFPIGYHDNY